MTLFFLLLHSARFSQLVQPALAETWRRRSFAPCRALCQELQPVAEAFVQRYAPAAGEPLVSQVAAGAPFRRELWPLLVGEVLTYAAEETAPVEADPDTLGLLLGGERWTDDLPHARFRPIHQALYGSRDLVFGGKFYRPHRAGFNDRDDVARLAEFLTAVDPERWTAAGLEGHPGLTDADDRDEEIEFARACFPELRQLYERAREVEYVVIRETL